MALLTGIKIPETTRLLSERQRRQDQIASALALAFERTTDKARWVNKGDLDRVAAAAIGEPSHDERFCSWRTRHLVAEYIKEQGLRTTRPGNRPRVWGLVKRTEEAAPKTTADLKKYWARRLAESGFRDIEDGDYLREGSSVETVVAPLASQENVLGWLDAMSGQSDVLSEIAGAVQEAHEREEGVTLLLRFQADVWSMHLAGLGPKKMEPWVRKRYGVGQHAIHRVLTQLKADNGIAINSLLQAASKRRRGSG